MHFPWLLMAFVTILFVPVQTRGAPLTIVEHPRHTEVLEGGKAQIRVVANGGLEPLKYQWILNGKLLPGATSAVMVIENASKIHEGEYVVSVSDSQGLPGEESWIRARPAKLFLFRDSDGDGLSDNFEIGWFRYRVIDGSFTWDAAKRDAESRGGHLATITSEEEWRTVRKILDPVFHTLPVGPWLGASDSEQEGIWRWVTGEPWSYTRWAEGEPNNRQDEDFLTLWGLRPDYQWNDLPASGFPRPYLLELGYPTDPFNPDSDADGLNDGSEFQLDLNSLDPDTDHDTFSDYLENRHGTDPKDPNVYPTLLSVTPAGNQQVLITLRTKGTAIFLVETSNDLKTWKVTHIMVSANGVGAILDSIGQSKFFRARELR